MSFHFASSDYAASFQGVPTADTAKIRQSAVDYLEQEFDPQSWYSDPVGHETIHVEMKRSLFH